MKALIQKNDDMDKISKNRLPKKIRKKLEVIMNLKKKMKILKKRLFKKNLIIILMY